MIITEKVKIKVTKTYRHFEEKGYIIPKKFEQRTKKYVANFEAEIEVLVKDLPKNSVIEVECKCDLCGKIRIQKYYRYRDICSNCMRTKIQLGENSPGWKHGNGMKKECIDCGTKIHWNTKRCSVCRTKYLKSLNKFCTDCGKPISRQAKRCSACANNGKNNPAYNENLTEQDREDQKYYKGIHKWKTEVRKKFNYTCKKCGKKGHKNSGIIECHHINNFKEYINLRIDVNNGIALCQQCHKEIHKKYGKLTNEKQLLEFLN